MNPSEIRTIRTGDEVKFKEKGSLFISQPFSIENEQSATEILREIKKKYFDASHHCYAWRLSDGNFKSSDDGEPSGTAGLRIMNAIDHYDLTNLIVIVTRWFGGTKLA
jgi:putative IMPACT (imprinted ancient) family translation regulator